MSYNGSGTFNRLFNWVNDRDAAIPITASRMDSEMDGMATGLSTAITKDGQTTVTANLPMANFRHTGVANAQARDDYSAAGQIQDGTLVYAVGGGTANAQTITLAPAITAYTDGMVLNFEAGATNTGNTTLNVNSVGAQSAVLQNGDELPPGAITIGRFYTAIYDLTNTNWVLINPSVITAQTVISAATTTNISSISAASLTTGTALTIPDGDALTTGQLFELISNSSDTSTRYIARIINDNAAATGAIPLRLDQDSTAAAMLIQHDGNGVAIDINTVATTANIIDIPNADSLTTGSILNAVSNSPSTGTKSLAVVHNDNTAAVNTTCLELIQDAAENAFSIDQNANARGMLIVSDSTTVDVIAVNADATTTGSAHFVTADGLTTGKIFNLVSNSTDTSTRELVTIHNQNSSATGATCLELIQGASTTALLITTAGSVAAVDIDSAGVALDIDAGTSTSVIDMRATDGSFAGIACRTIVDRAATSAYSFAQMLSNSGGDIEFNFRGDGNAFADGTFTGGGADYAEYFEWLDGNPDNEDRRGTAVELVGDKIAPATSKAKAFGVVSANPSIVGDAAWNRWKDKYLRDDFGSYVTEEYPVWHWVDETGKEFHVEPDKLKDDIEVPKDCEIIMQQRRKLNPEWDENAEYTPRSERREWGCVGIMGKLRIRKGQHTNSKWLKMRSISHAVDEWLIK